jgi:hypothetical protein
MSDFTIRSENVDVEDIMRQIRARIREKRGVDYTEQEIAELARVKLERFLDPQSLRSELLQAYRRQWPAPPPNYPFDHDTIYISSRGAAGRMLTALRRLLNPILKLFFNPTPVTHALHLQSRLNEYFLAARNDLTYEVLHNLVVELTRLGIENRNLKMRLESLAGRLEFHERRARSLEGAVQFRQPPTPARPDSTEGSEADAERSGRKRRRRRGRRRPSGAGVEGAQPMTATAIAEPEGPPAPESAPAAPSTPSPSGEPPADS